MTSTPVNTGESEMANKSKPKSMLRVLWLCLNHYWND
jgi:hypothetical protein